MSCIRDIRVVPLSFAPPEPYGSARGLARARSGSLVLLDTDDGVQGIGEAAGPGAVLQTWAEVLRPFYVGRSVFAQRAVAQEVFADVPRRHAEPDDGAARRRRPCRA